MTHEDYLASDLPFRGAQANGKIPWGAVPMPPHEAPARKPATGLLEAPVPESLDLRKAWNGVLKNQRYRGTCEGFAGSRAAEALAWSVYGWRVNLSAGAIYSMAVDLAAPEWSLADRKNPSKDGIGSWPVAQGMIQRGAPLEDEYPYDPAKIGEPLPAELPKTTEYKIGDCAYAWGWEDMKAALTRYGVSVLTLAIDAGWFTGADVIEPEPSSPIYSYHALPIFGYEPGFCWVLDSYNPDSLWHKLSRDMFDAGRTFDICSYLPDLSIGAGHKLSGDATGDGRVNMADVLTALNLCVGRGETHDFTRQVLDVDRNARVDVADVRALLWKTVGKG